MDCQWTSSSSSSSYCEHFSTTAHVPPNKLKFLMHIQYTNTTRIQRWNSIAACVCFAVGNLSTAKTMERNTCDLWIRYKSYAHYYSHQNKYYYESHAHTLTYTHFFCAADWFTFSNEQTCSSECMEFFIKLKCICFIVSGEWTNVWTFWCFISIQNVLFLDRIESKYLHCCSTFYFFKLNCRTFQIIYTSFSD